MLNILKNTAFLLTTLVFIPYCFSATIPDMKVCCTTSTPKVSFPFPGQPEVFSNPEFPEAYTYKDTTNYNSYQFYYKKIDKSLNESQYLGMVRDQRIKSVNATLISKKIYKSGNKTISDYSYFYYNLGIKKISHVKSVSTDNIYYSWAVQSYEGSSKYSADYIFDNYSKYVDNDGGFCK